jgi:hypothetical protein
MVLARKTFGDIRPAAITTRSLSFATRQTRSGGLLASALEAIIAAKLVGTIPTRLNANAELVWMADEDILEYMGDLLGARPRHHLA